MSVRILHGDALELLPTFSGLDSCVCDPPYHLTSIVKRFGSPNAAPAQFGTDGAFARASRGFMGKQWDGGDIALRPETWALVLQALKPGAHLLAFGGTRTFHRMACAIEDAGFEIRDSISYLYDGGLSGPLLWCFGSGFPKSHNVSRQLDHIRCRCPSHGATSIFTARKGMRDLRQDLVPGEQVSGGTQSNLLATMQRSAHIQDENGMHKSAPLLLCDVWEDGGETSVTQEQAGPNLLQASHRPQAAQQSDDQPRIVAGQSESQAGGAWPLCDRCGKPRIPEGLGTALKPAFEPIIVARKPLVGTVAQNVLKHGTGAINVDGCRIEATDGVPLFSSRGEPSCVALGDGLNGSNRTGQIGTGRWPANLCHDGSDEVLALFPETGVSSGGRIGNAGGGNVGNIPVGNFTAGDPGFGDSGSAARFFYCAKADADDRAWSKHPTVKPLALMRWLVRLVTPPGGTVLDCFAGSGTTGEAARLEGVNAVLIEREAEYVADIRRRLGRASGDDTPLFADAAAP